MGLTTHIRKSFDSWRYYKLNRVDYYKCLEKQFPKNLHGLWLIGVSFSVFLFIASILLLIPSVHDLHVIFARRGVPAGVIKFAVAVCTFLLAFYAQRKHVRYQQGKNVSTISIYALIIFMYIVIIITGIYQSVWSNPDGRAVLFMIFLICSLLLVTASPVFHLTLTIGAITVFIISVVSYKNPDEAVMDLMNLLLAAPLAIAVNWYSCSQRMSATMNEVRLKEERDGYRDESTIDELTQLKNRRDFMQRFQRYLTNYRDNDNFLCLAIMDIDHFKNYNDHYGHPMGDECLRAIGRAFAAPWENPSLYTARIGGEEFALLWFAEDMGNVNEIVLQAQQRVRDLKIAHEKSDTAEYITISIGVYVAASGKYSDTQEVYAAADIRLYEAKAKGRNRAVISGEDGLNPNFAMALSARGFANFQRGNLDLAIEDYSEAIRRGVAIPFVMAEIYNRRSTAYSMAGDIDKAIADIEAALRILPDNGNYKEALSSLQQLRV